MRSSLLAGIGAGVALIVGALVVFGGVLLWAPSSCSEDEQATFGEFAQFGGLRPEPEGNPQLNSCAAYFDTQASDEEILGYYRGQLRGHGWQVGGLGSDDNTVVATREEDGYYFQAETEAGGGEGGATHVAVHVARLSEV